MTHTDTAPVFTGYDSVTETDVSTITADSWVFMSPASVMTCTDSIGTRTARRVTHVRTETVDGLGRLTYIGYGPGRESVYMDGARVTVPAAR